VSQDSGFTLLDEVPGIVSFGAHENINIFVWTGAATEAITDRMARIVARQVAAESRGLSTIHVMTMLARPPTPEARAGFAAVAKRWQDTIVSVSLVFEREGFWGSAMRSAITGVMLLLPKGRYPLKVHRSIHEAAAWLPEQHAARSGVKIASSTLLAVITGLRTRALEQARQVSADVSQTA